MQKDNLLLVYQLILKWENEVMDRSENRLARVRQLVDEAGSLARFADIVGIAPAQAWQIAGNAPIRGIGAKMAARIEQAFDRVPGWLDHPVSEGNAEVSAELADEWPFKLAARDDYDRLTREEQRDLDRTVARFIAGCLAGR